MLDAAERKMLYAFLSVLFRHPEEDTLAAAGGVVEGTFASVFPGLPAPPLASLPELRSAYGRLFTSADGTLPAPPFGSAYLDRAGRPGASTRLVASLYNSAGLDTRQSPEPADYLPTELEFLYYLTEGEQQSRGMETGTPPQRWVASQADFFHNFFYPWVRPFCERVETASEGHPFYRWGAELLRRFADMENERLKVVPGR